MRKKHCISFVLHVGEYKVMPLHWDCKDIYNLIFDVRKIPCGNSFFKNDRDGKHLVIYFVKPCMCFDLN